MNRLIARFEVAAVVFVFGAVCVFHIAAQPGKPLGKIVYNAIVTEGLPEELRILDTVNNQVTTVPLQGFQVVREPVWFPVGDRIAFHANVGFGSAHIYTVRPDGNSLCQLTSGFGDFVTPTIPISAERIFFQGVSGDIFSIGSLCGSADLQTYPVRLSYAHVSPNGRYVAGSNWGISSFQSDGFVYDLLTGTLTKILQHQGQNAFVQLAWSPDGNKLVVHHINRGVNPPNGEIWTIDANGANPANLTPDWPDSEEDSPSWSPDGQWILFPSNRRGGNWDLWAMRPDGSGRTNLTSSPEIEAGPAAIFLTNNDSDGDGVPNDNDQCPNTPPGNVVDANGCSIDQLCPCGGPESGSPWKNHGQYVSCAAKNAESFLASGLITEDQKDMIVEAAAQSSCGKK